MTTEEAIKILELYREWNIGQKSLQYASGGTKTDEDRIYDARRALILEATRKLVEKTP